MCSFVVAALYKFVALPDYQDIAPKLKDHFDSLGLKGTLLLAEEGINGTVAGTREAIDGLLDYLKGDERFVNISHKESFYEGMPFYRMNVKLKKEIVTMGVNGIDPQKIVGTYVKPQDWNALISDPEVVVVDTRNHYEYSIGTFERAIDPKTETFREFPEYVANHLNPAKHKKVAMFCTGGIRCEKSTAYLKEQGFDEVYHLEGGILKYLEEVPEQESLWQGECFVFDERVAVNHRLEKGQHDLCHACRLPISAEDKASELYQEGVSCPHCHDKLTPEQRARFQERERQIKLARQRGEEHIGEEAARLIELRRHAKRQRSPEQEQP